MMRVFVIGSTGYVGSAVVAALRQRGDAVVGSARTEEAAKQLRDAGIEAAVCDITAPESLKAPAQSCDGAIYAVQYNGPDVAAVERAALAALVDALAGTGKPLLYTSGYWIYGHTSKPADEDAPLNPTPMIAHRSGQGSFTATAPASPQCGCSRQGRAARRVSSAMGAATGPSCNATIWHSSTHSPSKTLRQVQFTMRPTKHRLRFEKWPRRVA